MILFWLIAAAMIALALAAVLPPLLGARRRPAANRISAGAAAHRQRRAELDADRDSGVLGESEYAEALQELERAALEALNTAGPEVPVASSSSPVAAVVIALLVPTLAFGLYLQLGTPAATRPATVAPAGTGGDAAPAGAIPHSVEEMVARLESRLKGNPEDPDGWAMLGRSYAAINRLESARDAFVQAVQRKRDDPGILVDYAEVLARLAGGDLRGEPAKLVHAALEYSPDDRKALWLAGIASFQDGDFQHAQERLERLRGFGGFDPEQARVIDDVIAQARARASGAPMAATGDEAPPAPAAAAPTAARLSVRVQLSPDLSARAAPTDTLFVYARAATGPRMPLAIIRKHAGDLPLTVVLDDSLAMRPELKLSNFPEVVIEARISKTGNAAPAAGDLQGVSGTVVVGAATNLDIAIDQVVP